MDPTDRPTPPLRERVALAYRERFGADPDAVLFAPGRINLIGDHTDYSLLPVLPMAIQRGIAFAVGTTSTGTTIDSLDEPGEWQTGPLAPRPASWHRYVEAALVTTLDEDQNVQILLAGDLPSTGGLSSSSAFVVGLLAAITRNHDVPLSGRSLVGAAVAAERRAAIEGGEMDQTIIVFGEASAATRIEFDPPSTRAVPIPEGLTFVAADSGERAAKGASARDAYNSRVVACRCATALLARSLGREVPAALVLARVADAKSELVDALPEVITATEAAARTDVDASRLIGLSSGDFDTNAALPLRAVARHVLREATAVDAAEDKLRAGDLAGFGRLLDASHESLRDFGSSTAGLDRLTYALREAGALGARVTGAGFGGYAIAACREGEVDAIIEAARRTTGSDAFEVFASRGLG